MRFGGELLLAFCTVASPLAAGATGDARLTAESPIDPVYGQGIARVEDGWVVSGVNVLGHLDESFAETRRLGSVIPADLTARGFDHVGDPDVADGFLYVPLEQPDYERGEQAMARFDPETLAFVDATLVPQHHNSFVTVADGIAYTTDFFDDDTVLRYDVEDDWSALEPIDLTQPVERIQGGDIADGALWLSTDDPQHGLYRVGLGDGAVEAVGSMGHLDGEGEGVDATVLPSGLLHTLTVDAAITPVWLANFQVAGVASTENAGPSDDVDSRWPPVLVVAGLALLALAVVAVLFVFRRARATARAGRGREAR